MTEDQRTKITSYKKHLEDCFLIIGTDVTINQTCTPIAVSAMQIYSKLKSYTNSENWAFKIDPPWTLCLRDRKDEYFADTEGAILLSGETVVSNFRFEKYNFFTSVLRTHWAQNSAKYNSCCEAKSQGENRVVRRFHFDTCPGIEDTLEAKAHLQFGGICEEETAVNEQLGKTLHYCLDNRLDVPRLPYPPMDAILLFDVLIRQFPTDLGSEFAEKGEWIKAVKESEEFRLKDYYLAIQEYFGHKISKYKTKTLFQTMCTKDFCF